MLMIIPVQYQHTEEMHHVLDVHSDNCPWLHVGETGRAFRDGQGIVGFAVPRAVGHSGVRGSAALAKGIRGQWIEIICRLAPRTTMTGTWCEFVTIDAPDQ